MWSKPLTVSVGLSFLNLEGCSGCLVMSWLDGQGQCRNWPAIFRSATAFPLPQWAVLALQKVMVCPVLLCNSLIVSSTGGWTPLMSLAVHWLTLMIGRWLVNPRHMLSEPSSIWKPFVRRSISNLIDAKPTFGAFPRQVANGLGHKVWQ